MTTRTPTPTAFNARVEGYSVSNLPPRESEPAPVRQVVARAEHYNNTAADPDRVDAGYDPVARQKAKEAQKKRERRSLAGVATAGVIGIAALTLALNAGKDKDNSDSFRASLDENYPTKTITLGQGEGALDALAAVDPKLTAVGNQDPEMEAAALDFINDQADGTFLQEGQKVDVPIIPGQQLEK